MSVRIHNVIVTDSHRGAPSFEVESPCLCLTSRFTDISPHRFATLVRAEEVSRFSVSFAAGLHGAKISFNFSTEFTEVHKLTHLQIKAVH